MEKEKKEKEIRDEEKEMSESHALVLVEDKKEVNLDDKIEEDKNYNDVNYWHIEVNELINDDILKELE